MDANGLKFWMLSRDKDWDQLSGLEYEGRHRVLRLANQRVVPVWPASEAKAIALLERVPGSIDQFGMRAFLSQLGSVRGTGVAPDSLPLFMPEPGDKITDIVIGYDSLLYLAVAGGVTVLDLRGRVAPVKVQFPDQPKFSAWRLAAATPAGAWALDATNNRLARITGLPLFVQSHPPYSPNTVRPCQENPDPPRLLIESKAGWPANERAVAIATSPEGKLALLTWTQSDSARLRILTPEGVFDQVINLDGSLRPYSLTWVSSSAIAVMLPEQGEALVYPVAEDDDTADTDAAGDDDVVTAEPSGDVYPLRNHDGGPFFHGVGLPPSYPLHSGSAPLVKLSLPAYARTGSAHNAFLLDSGSPSTVWHRLYLEAMIPDHCGVIVHLAAVNEKDPVPASVQWFPHQFGRTFPNDGITPKGAWVPAASEVPFHPGVLDCPSERDRSGLFTVLIQRAGRRTRALQGRYLKLRVELVGDGRSTPKVAAARAYASRFSYAERYLPELYRESVFAPDADVQGQSTPADFLERFLGNFEGILTPLEDKIASSYLVTDVASAPEEALEWLGSWIGVAFDSAYSTTQRRELLRSAPELFRRRGTLAGLGLALDIATGGAVTRGQIVVLEDYRLRRTFATILGANLADVEDPLLGGISSSGNSFVGDTLFLGDEQKKEFLALFQDTLPKTARERSAVDAFFDQLAYRVTVLVHQEIDPLDFKLVRRIVDLETPAHVLARVATASHSFRVGVASLVGVDSYLAPRQERKSARVDLSRLGEDYVQGVASLDPRLSGNIVPSGPPVAKAKLPAQAEQGSSFKLDASQSAAPEGKAIVSYIWTLLD